MAYLITCSGSKRNPEIPNPSILQNLVYDDVLREARQELIQLADSNLNWDFTLPAYMLYSGNRSKIYSQVHQNSWNNPNTNVKILSALFGWINHTDLIPYYDLTMTTRINYNGHLKPVWKYWRDSNLLHNLINPDVDIDLLSINYRKALDGAGNNHIALNPDVKFTDRGIQKGRWLNNQLQNLI